MVLFKSRRVHFLYENPTPPKKIRWPDLKSCPLNFQILPTTFETPKVQHPSLFKGWVRAMIMKIIQTLSEFNTVCKFLTTCKNKLYICIITRSPPWDWKCTTWNFPMVGRAQFGRKTVQKLLNSVISYTNYGQLGTFGQG